MDRISTDHDAEGSPRGGCTGNESMADWGIHGEEDVHSHEGGHKSFSVIESEAFEASLALHETFTEATEKLQLRGAVQDSAREARKGRGGGRLNTDIFHWKMREG